MSDLIDRRMAIEAIMKHTGMTPIAKLEAETTICRVPSAEPERKKGKWDMSHASVYIKCSVCGEPFMMMPQNYCPNCGAKMEAGHE